MNRFFCFALLALASSGFRLSPTARSEVQSSEDARRNECRLTDKVTCPQWLCATLLGILFDVKLFCKFPEKEKVFAQFVEAEERIVSLTSTALITPGSGDQKARLDFFELHGKANEQDLNEKLKQLGEHDLQAAMGTLMVPHEDACANSSSFSPAETTTEIFNNIKSMLDEFDIFSKCTKSYVKRMRNGHPQVQKDDVIAVSTELAAGMFSLSFEDVSYYREATELVDGEPERALSLVVSSRKENVIEGNYDVSVRIRNGKVRMEYTKRQNLAEKVLRSGITHNGYAISTQKSVDFTLMKLAYAGLYGRTSVGNGGCYVEPAWSCADYARLKGGEKCSYDLECESESCVKEEGCHFPPCDYQCAGANGTPL